MRINRLPLILSFGLLTACSQQHNVTVGVESGMAVSAQHLAADTGASILRQGGNAVDAAVAMGYALSVTHPSCGNIDGGGFMIIRLANGKTRVIDFREKAPLLATRNNIYLHPQNLHEVYSDSATAGTVAGLNYAENHYGTLSVSKLIQPAIHYAQDGYKLTAGDVVFLNEGKKHFLKYAQLRNIYLNHGNTLSAGSRLVQPELAQTLKQIATSKDYAFYHGTIAKHLTQAMRQEHAPLNQTDLAQYTIQEVKPLHCRYRGYDIYTTPAPSYGGVELCEIMNILSKFPIANYKPFSAQAMAINIDAMNAASADAQKYIGDPAFIKIPYNYLLSQQHAAQIANQIKQGKAFHMTHKPQYESLNTTAISVVDKQGNAVSMIYTLNLFFGGGTTPDHLGFFLNNENIDFAMSQTGTPLLPSQSPNAFAPGKRPASGMSPTIITKNGQLFLVVGTPGGPTIPTQLALMLENRIDHHMSLAQSINLGRYHSGSNQSYINIERNGVPQDSLTKLRQLGFPIHFGSNYKYAYWGGVTAIEHSNGQLKGVMDKRRPGGKVAAG